MRLRLPGGRVATSALARLVDVAEVHGDGRVHVTSRTNLQVRAMPARPGTDVLPDDVLRALETTGLLPSRTHDLARNVMASPRSGVAGGRADLRPVVDALDATICADPHLGRLPGRFLFVLDDGSGDLLDRSCDLGLVALDAARGQMRVGEGWGLVVPLIEAHLHLARLARRFLALRGQGREAPWHVRELDVALVEERQPDRDLPPPSLAPPYGAVPGGHHLPVPPEGLDRAAVINLLDAAPTVVVTPWRGVFVPEETA